MSDRTPPCFTPFIQVITRPYSDVAAVLEVWREEQATKDCENGLPLSPPLPGEEWVDNNNRDGGMKEWTKIIMKNGGKEGNVDRTYIDVLRDGGMAGVAGRSNERTEGG